MKITIEWTYHHKGVETVFRSEEMPPAHALSVAEELMKTGKGAERTNQPRGLVRMFLEHFHT